MEFVYRENSVNINQNAVWFFTFSIQLKGFFPSTKLMDHAQIAEKFFREKLIAILVLVLIHSKLLIWVVDCICISICWSRFERRLIHIHIHVLLLVSRQIGVFSALWGSWNVTFLWSSIDIIVILVLGVLDGLLEALANIVGPNELEILIIWIWWRRNWSFQIAAHHLIQLRRFAFYLPDWSEILIVGLTLCRPNEVWTVVELICILNGSDCRIPDIFAAPNRIFLLTVELLESVGGKILGRGLLSWPLLELLHGLVGVTVVQWFHEMCVLRLAVWASHRLRIIAEVVETLMRM